LSQFALNANIFAAGATDTGLRRQHNEDCFLIDPETGLMVVADGMGGHEHGEVASAEAIRALREFLDQTARGGAADDGTLTDVELKFADETAARRGNSIVAAAGQLQDQVTAAVLRANDAVYSINQSRGLPAERAMGTTLIGLVCSTLDPRNGVGFHVGDSRMYRLRKGELELLTRDQTRHQKWLDEGSIGPEPPKNVVLNGVGPQPHLRPTTFLPSLRRGDRYLLCSDGLSDLVEAAEISEILQQAELRRLEVTCQALIDAANDRGGKDNITVIVAIHT
jgi:protein phosphatase